MAGAKRAVGLVLASTIIAGLGGYLITMLMAASLGEFYSQFAIFWSCLYLIVGTLAGVQQEASRSTRPAGAGPIDAGGVRLFPFALIIALVVTLVATLPALLISPIIFHGDATDLAWPLIFGTGTTVLVSFTLGGLYGTHAWRQLASLVILDVLFRLGLLWVTLQVTHEVVVLAWVSVVPFVLSICVVIPFSRRFINFRTRLDVAAPTALMHIGQTGVAALGTSVLVSGFPAMLAIFDKSVAPAVMGSAIFAITLTRAPLVVGTLALQSMLVVLFRDATHSIARRVVLGLAAIFVGAVILAGAAYLWGSAIFVFIAGPLFVVDSTWLFWVTLASAPTGALAITGAAALARGKHVFYSTGWVLAAIVSTLLLLAPLDFHLKIIVSLVVGPAIGVVVHLWALSNWNRRTKVNA